jgi:hypothetical protein
VAEHFAKRSLATFCTRSGGTALSSIATGFYTTEAQLDLIPGERAVLMQIRDMFLEGSARIYRLNMLMARWPFAHLDAYKGGLAGLVRRGLLAESPDGQAFTVTTAGLKAMLRS